MWERQATTLSEDTRQECEGRQQRVLLALCIYARMAIQQLDSWHDFLAGFTDIEKTLLSGLILGELIDANHPGDSVQSLLTKGRDTLNAYICGPLLYLDQDFSILDFNFRERDLQQISLKNGTGKDILQFRVSCCENRIWPP